MKVAAYAISLNEEKHAARWAETTKDADFRLVCDTGSTDRTVEILREHGVIVYEISVKPWRFDTARNTAQSLLPNDIDVCLSLDMDELVDENFFEEVKKQWVDGSTKGWCEFDTGHVWWGCRLHSRHKMYWKYPIHEVFVPSLDTENISCQIKGVKMYHKPDDTKSRGQYLPMLVAASKEFGEDHRIWVYLCREYYFYKQWELVISAAEKVTEFSKDWYIERAAVCRWAAEASRNIGKKQEGHAWADKAIEIDPCGENYYEKVRCYYDSGDWGGVWETCKLVAASAKTDHYLSSEALWRWQLDDMRGLSAHYLGDRDKAVQYGELALAGNPDDERLKTNLRFYRAGIEAQLNGTA
jgi:glycosyltransferase involved in cell wall biosynthesis